MDQFEDLTVVLEGEWMMDDLPPVGSVNQSEFLGYAPRTLFMHGRRCNRLPGGGVLPNPAVVSFYVNPAGWHASFPDADMSILGRGRPRIVPAAEVFAEAV
jgi:hypothetical protein